MGPPHPIPHRHPNNTRALPGVFPLPSPSCQGHPRSFAAFPNPPHPQKVGAASRGVPRGSRRGRGCFSLPVMSLIAHLFSAISRRCLLCLRDPGGGRSSPAKGSSSPAPPGQEGEMLRCSAPTPNSSRSILSPARTALSPGTGVLSPLGKNAPPLSASWSGQERSPRLPRGNNPVLCGRGQTPPERRWGQGAPDRGSRGRNRQRELGGGRSTGGSQAGGSPSPALCPQHNLRSRAAHGGVAAAPPVASSFPVAPLAAKRPGVSAKCIPSAPQASLPPWLLPSAFIPWHRSQLGALRD